MTAHRTALLAAAITFAATSHVLAQDTTRTATPTVPARWDVSALHGPSRDVEFETSEGTWMDVDVSPDGRSLVFDLLGDIYTMPITGGQASLIFGGPAFETMPRFSPDGQRIAFTSDRDGIENIWTADIAGGDLRQVSKERERQVSNPSWTPDGQYIVARKHFRNTRSLGSGEMWLYHIGGGAGMRMTDRRNWEQNATEPVVSRDGRYIYFSEDVSPGGGFQYNRDPHGVIYVVQRLDRESQERETFISAPGGSLAPNPSPDGNTIAFVRRIDTKTVLMLHDVASGRERALWDGLDLDQQEVWAIFGTYPGYSWTPDGSAIVIWAQGGLWRVDATTGSPTRIPFTAHVKQTLTDAVWFPQQVAPDVFDVKMLRWVSVSPNQRQVAYTALGKLYIRDLPNGTPRRVTRSNDFELYPAWSPDGRSLVYVTWNDSTYGAVRTVRTDGSNARAITTSPGHYIEPRFSPDGTRIVYRRIGGDGSRGALYSRDRGVYIVASNGGTPHLVTEQGSDPRFNRTSDRIYLSTREDGNAALVSVDLNGGDRRVHVTSENGGQFTPSPDERYIVWNERYNVHIAPFPVTGRAVNLSMGSSEYPVRKLSRDAGSFINWSSDSRRVYWSLGPELYSRDIAQTFAFETEDTTTLRRDPEAAGVNIGFSTPFDRPTGTIALTGANVITMRGDEVIRNATIVIDRNRITAVGPRAEVQIPNGAHTIDVSNRWIMPGIVDVHAHVGAGSSGITPRSHWPFQVNLAFGVTTMHDPSNNTDMVFSASELIKAGEVLGPRLFSTGTILYGAEGNAKAITTSFDDALGHLRRLKAAGAFSVKSYSQPRRDARQQIIEAARELEMMVVPEGGSTFFFNMTHVLDGHTGVEHNVPVAPLYRDVIELWRASSVGYTPTLIVNYNGLNGEYWFYQHDEVWRNARLRQFTPPDEIVPRSRRRLMAGDDDYTYIRTSQAAKALLDAGVKVNLGAHGQRDGLGAHWELWMLAQGGMTPLEALRAATLNGAEYLGLDGDIGSIAPGKLADMIVLDADPLTDIRNSETIRYVVLNGRVYDAMTLEQLGNQPAPPPARLWQ